MQRRAEPEPAHDPRSLPRILLDELTQRRESGFLVDGIEHDVTSAIASGANLEGWFDELEMLKRRDDWGYDEPSGLEDILATLSGPGPELGMGGPTLPVRLHGAWLGRCAGCMMGKPVEGWSRTDVRRHLDRTGSRPLRDYVPGPHEDGEGPPMKPSWPITTRGRVDGVARDDDIDYTILGLHLLETHGPVFTADHVLEELVDHLPFTQVFTAERVAYGNVVDGYRPPETATRRNPYREWIGALIRADIYGYVSPGKPRAAALMAYRDASTSHVSNGIYGAMWAAALISACLVEDQGDVAARAALRQVPSGSRLFEALASVLELYEAGETWDVAMDDIDRRWGSYHWVHVVPNAAAIEAAVLWSGGDHLRGIGLAVEAGRDTDSTAATVGSALGALRGGSGVNHALSEPLHDRIRSAISGFDGSSIAALAARTSRLAAPAQQ